MSTTTIISNIRMLPVADQFFIIEQVLKSMHNTERKQAEFTESAEGYMTSEEFRRHANIKVNQFCDKYGIL